MATSRLIARSPIALSGLLLAAVLALASEEGAAEPAIARHEHERPAPAARAGQSPEIAALLATHSALHRAAVEHAEHRKEQESIASGRPINLPVIPKSPPVCSAPVFCR